MAEEHDNNDIAQQPVEGAAPVEQPASASAPQQPASAPAPTPQPAPQQSASTPQPEQPAQPQGAQPAPAPQQQVPPAGAQPYSQAQPHQPYAQPLYAQPVYPPAPLTKLSGGMKFAWFVIGALVGIPGIILAWVCNVDKYPQVKTDAVKFSAIGFAVWIVLGILCCMMVGGVLAAAIAGYDTGYHGYYGSMW